MSADLSGALGELAALLRCCGEEARAAWVDERRERIAGAGDTARARERLEIRNVLAGMGSLGDLYLEPTAECELTEREVVARQAELIRRLDLLTGYSGPAQESRRAIAVGQSSTDLDDRGG